MIRLRKEREEDLEYEKLLKDPKFINEQNFFISSDGTLRESVPYLRASYKFEEEPIVNKKGKK